MVNFTNPDRVCDKELIVLTVPKQTNSQIFDVNHIFNSITEMEEYLNNNYQLRKMKTDSNGRVIEEHDIEFKISIEMNK